MFFVFGGDEIHNCLLYCIASELYFAVYNLGSR